MASIAIVDELYIIDIQNYILIDNGWGNGIVKSKFQLHVKIIICITNPGEKLDFVLQHPFSLNQGMMTLIYRS
jgi:hypothetical protein